jgi:MarR family transcriptional regulator, negative regulator of the multidrug operon emrRAB
VLVAQTFALTNQVSGDPGGAACSDPINSSAARERPELGGDLARAVYHAEVIAQMNESVIDRTTNLLGAAAVALADVQRAAVEGASGQGAAAPAALVAVGKYSGETVRFFVPILGLTQSGTVRLIDRLVDDGLVRRAPGRDGRTVALDLTAAGRRAAARVARARGLALADALLGLDRDELAALERALEKILARFPVNRDDARHLCRLCDIDVCEGCPVDAAATAAGFPR